MIDLPRTKEGYAQFLQTAFWKDLTGRKKAMVGRCEQCGASGDLQSHHVRYPWPWFETTLDDLRVLCRACHEKEHGIGVVTQTPPQPVLQPYTEVPNVFLSFEHLLHYRSKRLVSRAEFVRQRDLLLKQGKPVKQCGREKKRRKKRTREERLAIAARQRELERKRKLKKIEAEAKRQAEIVRRLKSQPRQPVKPYRPKWINRGTSSN